MRVFKRSAMPRSNGIYVPPRPALLNPMSSNNPHQAFDSLRFVRADYGQRYKSRG